MLVTEEQAKEMWCPAVRLTATSTVTDSEWHDNRGTQTNTQLGESACIGSKCMWFRWVPDAAVTVKGEITAIIDVQDSKEIYDLKWWWGGNYIKGDKGYLHRWIVTRRIGEIPDALYVDHIDGDPLNNRFGNLRLCEPHQNSANARTRGGKSTYRGVFQQISGRWTSQISSQGNRICLGTYDTEEEAAEAYDKAALSIHGEFARLNLTGPVLNSGRLGFCGASGKP